MHNNKQQSQSLAVLALLPIAFCLIIIFHWQGNSADVHVFGRSVFTWMVTRWNDYGGRYSHCYLIPLVSLAALWRLRPQIAAAEKATDRVGLIFIALCLLLQIAASRAQLPRVSIVAFIGLLWSIPYYLYGGMLARHLIFPCAYLLFCIPLTFLDSLTFPLRIFTAQVSTAFLNGVGIETVRRGTALISPQNTFQVDIADPCSGLRSFLALTSLTAAYAYFAQRTFVRKWLLFLCAPVVAIIANIIRIIGITIVAVLFGQEAAVGVYHDYSGYIVFVTAVLLVTSLGRLINVDIVDIKKRWTE